MKETYPPRTAPTAFGASVEYPRLKDRGLYALLAEPIRAVCLNKVFMVWIAADGTFTSLHSKHKSHEPA
jgi:hypothetical protein